MLSLEEARELVLSQVKPLEVETIGLLDVVGRIAAADLKSDIDVAPFAHSSMDGFALRAEQIANASPQAPVELDVIAEVPAGSHYDGPIEEGQCVRIMTGAVVPEAADSIVKYEIVGIVSGDGRTGSSVSFTQPTDLHSNVRNAGEEAHAGDIVMHAGEIIHPAGVGFLASCGVIEVPTYRRPRIAIIATGSELVEPSTVPTQGKIRNSNSYALAACALSAGAIPEVRPIVVDKFDVLRDAVLSCTEDFDFIVTSGGAADGDFDFIKQVVEDAGELLMTTVNMRPGKAQTFGIVNGTPVMGLPGNPAAAYLGFEMIIRPALRKMQGYTHFDHTIVKARLMRETRKKDTRRFFLRGTLTRGEDGMYEAVTASNQSSGLFGPIQRANCFVILPEGTGVFQVGDIVDCVVLDIPEEVAL